LPKPVVAPTPVPEPVPVKVEEKRPEAPSIEPVKKDVRPDKKKRGAAVGPRPASKLEDGEEAKAAPIVAPDKNELKRPEP
jgi:hypothetical protein